MSQDIPWTNCRIVARFQGFEVVIVYEKPSEGCSATPSQCGAPFLDPPTYGGPKPTKPAKQVKSTPAWTHEGPMQTLRPGVHWGCDTRPAKNVIPLPAGKGSELYYGVTGESQLRS